MIFAAKNKPLKNVTLLLNKQAIEEKDYVKYLGILIDSQLTFSHHIASVAKKLAQVIGTMYRIRNYIDNRTCKMIYNSLIYPFLLYGVPVWGNADDVHTRSILTIQKRAVRIIAKRHYINDDTFERTHSAPLFKDLKLLKIHDIFNIETLKFVQDSLHNTNPSQFHNYYHYPPTPHNTAANRKIDLNTPSVRTTTYGLKSLKYCGVQIWNKIKTSTLALTKLRLDAW